MNTNRALWPGKYRKSIEMHTRAFCPFPSERKPKTVPSNPKQTLDDWISALPLRLLPPPGALPGPNEPGWAAAMRGSTRLNTGSCYWPSAVPPPLFAASRHFTKMHHCVGVCIRYSIICWFYLNCLHKDVTGKKKKTRYSIVPLEAVLTKNASLLLIIQATVTPFKN